MYARSSTIHAQPLSLDEGISFMREQTMPALMEIPGCIGLSLLVDREFGHCIATSSWESEEAMRASADAASSLRMMATGRFAGTIDKIEEWEIAVLHREHLATGGSCVRCTWLRCQMGGMEQLIDTFVHTVLPEVEGMDGFCSASMFVDRMSGRAVSATAWDTHDAMESNRERVHQLRTSTAARLGTTVMDVQEFELSIAHLRVPELV
jgi:heme-degrading monooxygenase HmoA